ncbi:MAG: sigma-70 family RNA polymerase sigma factor [Planctomycetia bacterium]|nr:sigma-70 family RNA polymerase sigma factor [Planctomycetia bacterium]
MNPDNFKPQSPLATPSEWGLEELFRLYEKELLGTLFHILGNAEDARDALQEGFIRCWKYKDQLNEINNLRAWVFRVVFNVGRDIRKNAWRKYRRAFAEDESNLAGESKTAEEIFADKEEIQFLRKLIQQLDESEKEIFLLRQNGLLTYEQIAQIVEIPIGTVKTRMRRALIKLQTLSQNQSFPSEIQAKSATEEEA